MAKTLCARVRHCFLHKSMLFKKEWNFFCRRFFSSLKFWRWWIFKINMNKYTILIIIELNVCMYRVRSFSRSIVINSNYISNMILTKGHTYTSEIFRLLLLPHGTFSLSEFLPEAFHFTIVKHLNGCVFLFICHSKNDGPNFS